MADEQNSFLILTIGVEQSVIDFTKSKWPHAQFLFLEGEKIYSLIDSPPTPSPSVALCGQNEIQISPQEIAQLIRTQFQETPVFYVSEFPTAQKKEDLIKNGFH